MKAPWEHGAVEEGEETRVQPGLMSRGVLPQARQEWKEGPPASTLPSPAQPMQMQPAVGVPPHPGAAIARAFERAGASSFSATVSGTSATGGVRRHDEFCHQICDMIRSPRRPPQQATLDAPSPAAAGGKSKNTASSSQRRGASPRSRSRSRMEASLAARPQARSASPARPALRSASPSRPRIGRSASPVRQVSRAASPQRGPLSPRPASPRSSMLAAGSSTRCLGMQPILAARHGSTPVVQGVGRSGYYPGMASSSSGSAYAAPMPSPRVNAVMRTMSGMSPQTAFSRSQAARSAGTQSANRTTNALLAARVPAPLGGYK